MKKLEPFVGIAPKLGGTGFLKFTLWFDKDGRPYVQIVANDAGGTFSDLLYSVLENSSICQREATPISVVGVDPASGKSKDSGNTNDPAFLRAVLTHLLSKT